MQTTYKVGDKVRIISTGAALLGFSIGDIVEITESKHDGSKTGGKYTFEVDGWGFCDAEHIELVSPKPTKNQRLTSAEQAISTLEQKVEAMQAEIDALKAAQKSADIAKIADGLAKMVAKEKKLTANEQASANKKRKAIIDEAKAFVEDVQKRDYRVRSTPAITSFQKSVFFGQTDELVFHVNAEKRTVVAIIRTISGKHVVHKGIAKCNPSDVFNADIGKAIALGRALGLDVSKFEKAVQPTEFAVGQIALCGRGKPYTITEVREDRGMTKPGTFHWKRELRSGVVKITNDTEAKY